LFQISGLRRAEAATAAQASVMCQASESKGISNDEVFFPFDIHYFLFGVLQFSGF
jgi:hypothetical protein